MKACRSPCWWNLHRTCFLVSAPKTSAFGQRMMVSWSSRYAVAEHLHRIERSPRPSALTRRMCPKSEGEPDAAQCPQDTAVSAEFDPERSSLAWAVAMRQFHQVPTI